VNFAFDLNVGNFLLEGRNFTNGRMKKESYRKIDTVVEKELGLNEWRCVWTFISIY